MPNTLILGSTGPDVSALQKALGITPDGNFGIKTQNAVIAYQNAHKLTPDGIVGEQTAARLIMGNAATPIPYYDDKINWGALTGHVPAQVLTDIQKFAQQFECNNPLRLAHFLGQCDHETGHWTRRTEGLNYGVDALMELFPRHFNPDEYAKYARHPEAIANRIYANRMGNSDEASGDGWKYRGRGDLQTTGKANYQQLSDFIKDPTIMSNPELVETVYPVAAAMFFFWKQKLWPICDKGISADVLAEVRRHTNGGSIGLLDNGLTKGSATLTKEYAKLLGVG